MLDQVTEELRELGFRPNLISFPNFDPSRQVVVIEITVENGRYKGQQLSIGFSFQENTYPEYPPHFIHLKSCVQTDIVTRYMVHEHERVEWSVYSLPPSDFWDGLDPAQKNMNTYFKRHIVRILSQL